MIVVDTQEATGQLSSLLRAVEQGEWVRFCREGRPVADLRPVSEAKDPLQQHPELMGVRFHEDPMLPLSEDGWPPPE
jgi:antitoxin (DNA-binding transcriptional repressor) of toxin-antitoxin stability system